MPKQSIKSKCETLSDAPYLVYGKSDCGFTQGALRTLDEKKLSHKFLDISEYQTEFFKICQPKIGNHRTVPVIFHQGKFVGGYDDLVKYISKRK